MSASAAASSARSAAEVSHASLRFLTTFAGAPTAMLKSAIFGGTAALVASYVGFHAEPTIEGTSVATTRAVVNASLLVLMFNFVLSALLFRS